MSQFLEKCRHRQTDRQTDRAKKSNALKFLELCQKCINKNVLQS